MAETLTGEAHALPDTTDLEMTSPSDPGDRQLGELDLARRRRRRFWLVVRLLRVAAWLWLAAAVLDLIRQADQLAWPAAAAAVSLLFAGALVLAYRAEEVRNHG